MPDTGDFSRRDFLRLLILTTSSAVLAVLFNSNKVQAGSVGIESTSNKHEPKDSDFYSPDSVPNFPFLGEKKLDPAEILPFLNSHIKFQKSLVNNHGQQKSYSEQQVQEVYIKALTEILKTTSGSQLLTQIVTLMRLISEFGPSLQIEAKIVGDKDKLPSVGFSSTSRISIATLVPKHHSRHHSMQR